MNNNLNVRMEDTLMANPVQMIMCATIYLLIISGMAFIILSGISFVIDAIKSTGFDSVLSIQAVILAILLLVDSYTRQRGRTK